MTAREPSMLKPDGTVDRTAPPPAARAVDARPASEPEPREAPAEGPTVVVAGFWHRMVAGLVDCVVVVPVAWLIVWLASSLAGLRLPDAGRAGLDYWLDLALAGDPALWGGVTLVAAVVVIYLLAFQAMAGRTPGMRLLRLRVIDVYGDPPSVIRAVARTAGYLACFVTFSLGFVWIGFDREKRGLHDWLAGTYVVRAGGGAA